MIYLRVALTSVWMILACLLGLAGCLVRWGDPIMNRHFGRFFAWGATRLSGIRVVFEGLEHLEAHQPCIYVSNHQSSMDMAVLGDIFPRNTVLVGKKELIYIPLFGLFFKGAGNIMINRSRRVSAMASLSEAVEQIRKRRLSVYVFPEGTRNRSEAPMLPFKRGAFYMAIQAQVPIVPVVCSSLDRVMSWKEKRMQGGTVRVRVLPPIPTQSYAAADAEQLGREVRDQMITAWSEISRVGSVSGS